MKPILFNSEMVQAILDGRKAVTRRAIKLRYRADENECSIFADGTERYVNSPYDVGDVPYVRETFCPYDADHVINGVKYAYKADAISGSEDMRRAYGYKWRPSIHMPREAARIFLRVTGVRVERLQEITEEQAEAEGVRAKHERSCDGTSARIAFAELWDSTLLPNLNKFKRNKNSWSDNPWVWALEFERCDKP